MATMLIITTLVQVPVHNRWLGRLRVLAMGLTVTTAAGVGVGLWLWVNSQQLRQQDLMDQLVRWGSVGTSATLAAMGTVAMASLAPGLIRGELEPKVPPRPLRLRCPRCRRMQPFTTGGATCDQCGLTITVTLT